LPSGPLLGNGDLGISVGCNKERTEVTLYLGLNQVWLLNEYQHWSDNSGDQVGPRRLGGGGITISAPEIASGNFSAELDMTLAEARVQLGPMSLRILLGERTPFTPSAYPTGHNGSSILVEINSSIPLTLNVTGWSLGLGTVCGRKVPHPHTTPCSTMDGATNAGATPEGILWTQRTPFIFNAKPVSIATASTLVRSAGGSTSEHGLRPSCAVNPAGSNSATCIYPEVSGSAALLAQVVTNHDMCETFAGCSNPLPTAQQAAAAFGAQNLTAAVATVQCSHDTFWTEFWQRTTVSLGNSVVQNLWVSLQFLAGSSSRAATVAPGLFGPWVFTDYPPWSGDYTLDYNFQANFWGMYSSNRVDLASSFFKPMMDFVPKARRAAGYKNCSALSFAAHIGPFGFASADSGMAQGDEHGDLGFQDNGLFAGMNFVLHWEHTHDLLWLKTTGFPYLRDNFALYQCLLEKLPDGTYVDTKDSDTECSTTGHFPGGWNTRCKRKSFGMAVAFVKRAGAVLPEMARALGVPVDPEWADISHNLISPPAFNGSFSSCDNETGKFPECNGALTSWAIWPGEVVNLDDSPELIAQGLQTVRTNDGFTCNNCFDNSFNAALRVGMELEELLPYLYAVLQPCSGKQMRTTADMCMLENGIPSVPGGVEVMGALEFISSMVMQSVTRHGVYGGTRYYTTLFPAINRSEAASFTRLRARGAFLISASWDEVKQAIVSPVTVASEAGGSSMLICLHFARLL
jgi:hypothetical protein